MDALNASNHHDPIYDTWWYFDSAWVVFFFVFFGFGIFFVAIPWYPDDPTYSYNSTTRRNYYRNNATYAHALTDTVLAPSPVVPPAVVAAPVPNLAQLKMKEISQQSKFGCEQEEE